MLMIDNLKNYLYDKNYFINIYDNYLHIFNYQKLVDFTDKKMIIIMPKFKLIINGQNLFITKMLKNELLITGEIFSLEKVNE